MNRPTKRIARAMRVHRQQREFDRALRAATPTMRQELLAAASRMNYLS